MALPCQSSETPILLPVHAEFFQGSIHNTFFGEPNDDSHTNAQNVNLIDETRSRRLQTID